MDPLAGIAAQQPLSFSQAFGDVVAPTTTTTTTTGQSGPSLQQEIQQQPANPSDNHAFIGAQPHVLYVSPRQKGNPVLAHIRNVPWHHQTMAPDYMFNSTSCALFLSVKYHLLHPNYILERMAELHFKFQVLLVLVDAEDNAKALLSLNTLCVRHDFTLILAFSEQEAARYLESYKALDGKDPASIVQRNHRGGNNFGDHVMDALTAIPKVNTQDATHLVTQFDSIQAVAQATPDELALVAGLGHVKVQRIYDAFHKPFSKLAATERKAKKQQAEYEREKQAEEKEAEEESEEEEADG